MPECMRDMLERNGRVKYPASIRQFAVTLHFYSPKAYQFVRKTWKNLLPAISTLGTWYNKAVEGKPGFTNEAFAALQAKTMTADNVVRPLACNLVIDEMSIREQVLTSNSGEVYGVVDLGTNTDIEADIDDVPKAEKALVFLAVSLKEKFKIPVGYFLVSSLTAGEQGNLVKTCLEHLHDSNTHVHSITFDGLVTNLSMARKLGANLEYRENFNPSFLHPRRL